MRIIELDERYEKLYFVCLEDWSDEMKEAWYGKQVRTGPPPSYEKIKDTIAGRLRQIR